MAVGEREAPEVEAVFSAMRRRLYGTPDASLNEIAAAGADPFRVLVTTMISLRTKDEVTSQASERLFGEARTPSEMAALSEDRIAELIYPAGFYRNKAKHIRSTSRMLCNRHDGKVPPQREALVALPGVGVKTANLTLNLGFGIEAICVDTHVHRISNRLGWIDTRTPEESECALEVMLPKSHWIEVNALFVRFGRQVCTPVSPKCSECPVAACPRVGVERSR